MIFSADIKNKIREYVDRSRIYIRALARRASPAVSLRPKRENEFLSRVFAMTLLAAATGGIFGLLPHWPMRPWFEGMWLGVALSLTAARRNSGDTLLNSRRIKIGVPGIPLGWRILLGALFGTGLQAFARISYPYVGMAVLGTGIGALMADSASDSNVKMDTILATIVSATLGGWAIARLGPHVTFNMPPAIAMAVKWGILGMFFSLGSLPAHVIVISNTVLKHVRHIRRKLEKEYRAHLDRLLDKYIDLAATDPDRSPADMELFLMKKAKIEETLLETADTSLALQAVDRVMRGIPEESLRAHLGNLRARYENVADPGVRSEINKALMEIQDSLTRRERLKLESERLKLILFRMNMDMEFSVPSQ